MNPIMLMILFGLIYVALCAMTGVMGRHTRIGFWGFLFLSLLVTPLLPVVAIYLTSPQPPGKK